MVGLAFEVSDTQQLKDQKRRQDDVDNELELKLRFQGVARPDFSDVFHYAFCYIGVLTGPYYKYRTYLVGFIHQPSKIVLAPYFLTLLYLIIIQSVNPLLIYRSHDFVPSRFLILIFVIEAI